MRVPNGGGFGGKSDPFNHEICAAKMSMLTGRPVKVALTREEVFWCHRGRHPVLMRSKIGVTKTGRITALDFHSFLDGGAYGSYGTASTFYTGALQTVTYAVENYHFRGARFFTNKAPCGPKRGHGTRAAALRHSRCSSTRWRATLAWTPRRCVSTTLPSGIR